MTASAAGYSSSFPGSQPSLEPASLFRAAFSEPVSTSQPQNLATQPLISNHNSALPFICDVGAEPMGTLPEVIMAVDWVRIVYRVLASGID